VPALLARPDLRRPPGDASRPLDDLLSTVDLAVSKGLNPSHPGHLGFIPGSGLVSAAIADFLAGTLYVTSETHQCVAKAARLAGFPADAVRVVPVDDQLRMDPDALRALLATDRAAGRRPFLLVANAGSTNTGTIDPLTTLADLAAAEDLWLHVDAAYGGFFQLTDRGRERLRGIERSCSTRTRACSCRSAPDPCWSATVTCCAARTRVPTTATTCRTSGTCRCPTSPPTVPN
jgi:hypothetical protein